MFKKLEERADALKRDLEAEVGKHIPSIDEQVRFSVEELEKTTLRITVCRIRHESDTARTEEE